MKGAQCLGQGFRFYVTTTQNATIEDVNLVITESAPMLIQSISRDVCGYVCHIMYVVKCPLR